MGGSVRWVEAQPGVLWGSPRCVVSAARAELEPSHPPVTWLVTDWRPPRTHARAPPNCSPPYRDAFPPDRRPVHDFVLGYRLALVVRARPRARGLAAADLQLHVLQLDAHLLIWSGCLDLGGCFVGSLKFEGFSVGSVGLHAPKANDRKPLNSNPQTAESAAPPQKVKRTGKTPQNSTPPPAGSISFPPPRP